MAVTNGVNLLVEIDGALYGCISTQSLDFTADMIDTTCKDTGSFKTFEPGEKSGTLTAELLYNYSAPEGVVTAFDDWKAGTQVSWKYGNFETGEGYFYGEGFVESISMSAPKNDVATATVTIQITGEPGTTTMT